MASNRTIAVAATVAVAGVVAYAAYFDYKRRNDVEFRKKLPQSRESLAASSLGGPITPEQLSQALELVKNDPPPASAAAKEDYFMQQVAAGESLATQGPEFHLPAALAFYRALRVYPSPLELMQIYDKTVPPPIFKIVLELTNLDVSTLISGGGPSIVQDEENAEKSSSSRQSAETSPSRAPSEASSQEWDKVTDPGTQTPNLF
ncbi:hypothetical protein ONZ45_g4894 [Pleurotus djamor]|nr:hypothetical protein ONZ45_g4894 [Pleurotus djamor]